MAKFEVVKTTPMASRDASKPWQATMVKGLYTDDEGEIEMVEVMLFGEQGKAPPQFKDGALVTPIFGVRRNKTNNRPEFVISALRPLAANLAAA
jgi:hypothetical protein